MNEELRVVSIAVIWVIRVFAILIAIWQIIGLVPVITWQLNPDAITSGMKTLAMIKVGYLIIAVIAFWALSKPLKKLKLINEE